MARKEKEALAHFRRPETDFRLAFSHWFENQSKPRPKPRVSVFPSTPRTISSLTPAA